MPCAVGHSECTAWLLGLAQCGLPLLVHGVDGNAEADQPPHERGVLLSVGVFPTGTVEQGIPVVVCPERVGPGGNVPLQSLARVITVFTENVQSVIPIVVNHVRVGPALPKYAQLLLVGETA